MGQGSNESVGDVAADTLLLQDSNHLEVVKSGIYEQADVCKHGFLYGYLTGVLT